MPPKKAAGRSAARRTVTLADRCATVPVKMNALIAQSGPSGALTWAHHELAEILAHLHNGIITRAPGRGDVAANLWLVRAAHEFAAAVGVLRPPEDEKRRHLEFAAHSLLPFCKRVVQEFISDKGMDGVWMDDSGILAGLTRPGRKNAVLATPLRLNALWYAALEVTGMALRGLTPMGAGRGHAEPGQRAVKDPTGDHFERLAGRFRRAFTKSYWCEDHDRICPPELRVEGADPDHGPIPDAEQLLLLILPDSPIPRTKQMGILAQIEAHSQNTLGIPMCNEKNERVESLLHRAWLAQALGRDPDNPALKQRAIAAARPLEPLRDLAQTRGLHAFYKDGKPLGPDTNPVVTAEVLGTLERFFGGPGLAAER